MKYEILHKIMNELKIKLNTKEDTDIICEFLEGREDSIRDEIRKTETYKRLNNELNQLEEEIHKNYNESIVKIIEKYENAFCENSCFNEQYMYRYGLLDGLCLALETSKITNIEK